MNRHIVQPPAGGPVQQAGEVIDVAVDAAVGAEADQVQGAAIGQQCVGQAVDRIISGQAAVAYGLADANKLLADDSARTNREVANLGVAHLVVRQPYRRPARLDQGVWIGMPEGIHHRSVGRTNGIVFAVMAVAPAIQNGQHDWCHRA